MVNIVIIVCTYIHEGNQDQEKLRKQGGGGSCLPPPVLLLLPKRFEGQLFHL